MRGKYKRMLNVDRIGLVIKLIREKPVSKNEIIEVLIKKEEEDSEGILKLRGKIYDRYRKAVEKILEYLEVWDLIDKIDGRWVWIDYYHKPKMDMHLHTLDLIQPLTDIVSLDFDEFMLRIDDISGDISIELLMHLEVEYPSLYVGLNKFMYIDPHTVYATDFVLEKYEELYRQVVHEIKALIKYVEAGGTFRYRVCDICRPKKKGEET